MERCAEYNHYWYENTRVTSISEGQSIETIIEKCVLCGEMRSTTSKPEQHLLKGEIAWMMDT